MSTTSPAIRVEARPAPIEFRPETTAVIVVDMQNDFATDGGMFQRAGIDISVVQAIVEPTRRVLAAARASGMAVVYLKMGFSPDLSDSGFPSGPTWIKHLPMHAGLTVSAPDGSPSRILIRDTWNTEIIEALAPEPDDVVVQKHRYSGFYETRLDQVLRDRGVGSLVFVGATTSVCVESTVRDAVFRDYHCLVLEDCVAEPIAADAPRSNHEATLTVLELLFASIADSSALIDAITSAQPVAIEP